MIVKETSRQKKSKAVLSASRRRHLKLFSEAGMYVSSQEVVSLLKSQSSKPSMLLQKGALPGTRPQQFCSPACKRIAAVAPRELFLIYSSLNKTRNGVNAS